jgi:hypothetical protein
MMEAATTQAEATGLVIVQDGAGLGGAGEGQDACLKIEEEVGQGQNIRQIPGERRRQGKFDRRVI